MPDNIDFPFKIGDRITYKEEGLAGVYIVISEDPNQFWMKHPDHTIYLRYDPADMKLATGFNNAI